MSFIPVRPVRRMALAAAALAVALGVPSAVLAGATPTVTVTIADRCVRAYDFVKGGTITVTLKRSGAVVDRASFALKSTGWTTCLSASVKSKDTLVVKQVKNGSTVLDRSIKMPVLTVALDVPNETIRGHAERGGSPLVGDDALIESARTIGGGRQIGFIWSGSFDSSGDVENAFTGLMSPEATYLAALTWRNGAGTEVTVATAQSTVAIRTGKPSVVGFGKPGTSTTVTLRTAGGALRAKATATTRFFFLDPLFKGTFLNGSTKVTPAVGDRITSSRRPGSWTVMADTLAVTSGMGTGTASVTCPNNVSAAMYADGNPQGANTFATGAVEFTDAFIPSGATVEIVCQDANGFAQWFSKVAP